MDTKFHAHRPQLSHLKWTQKNQIYHNLCNQLKLKSIYNRLIIQLIAFLL